MSLFKKLFGKSHSTEEVADHQVTMGMPTVEFDASKVTEEIQKDIEESLLAVPEFSEADCQKLFPAALEAVTNGRDLAVLYQAITGSGFKAMTNGRAGDITSWVVNRAMALIERERRLQLGMHRAIWIHAAPCQLNPSNPSEDEALQDRAHQAANGQEYDIAKGMFLNGHWTLPGREWGCKCSSKSVLPF